MSYRQQGYRPQATQQARGQRASGGRKTPPKSQKSRARRRRGSPFRKFLFLVLFAILATAGVMGYMVVDEVGSVERANTFYPGVFVNGYELHGASWDDAYNFLYTQAVNDLSAFQLQITYGDREPWVITTETLGMMDGLDATVMEAVNNAYMVGRTGSTLERYQTIVGLKNEPYAIYTAESQKNMSRLEGILSEIQAAVYVPAENAQDMFDFSRSNPVVILSEVVGQQLDVESFRAQLTDMINGMQSGVLAVEPVPVYPEVTASVLENKVVRLANFSTPIARYSTEERNKNVMRGVDAFHGLVIKDGQTVSFNSVVGKRTTDNGFYDALEIVSGEYEMGTGGGICQVSTTLYNAVIQAGLKVVKRQNHGIPVNYADMGADATVTDSGKDFQFKNNTGADIYIVAKFVDGGNRDSRSCNFQIYGRPNPNGHTYALRHETVEEIPIPKATKIADRTGEHAKYLDESVQVSDGQVGYKVRTYLLTKDANGNVVREDELYVDTYSAQPPKIYVGVERR